MKIFIDLIYDLLFAYERNKLLLQDILHCGTRKFFVLNSSAKNIHDEIFSSSKLNENLS